MKKILILVGAAGVAVAIAIGARNQLTLDREAAQTNETSVVRRAQARPASGDAGIQPGLVNGGAVAELPAGSPLPGPQREASSAAAAPAPAQPTVQHEAQPESPETDAILRRASAAYGKVRSLRATFTQQIDNPLLGTHINSEGTLYQRRPDRILLKFSKPDGDLLMSDGRYFWVFYPSVDAKQVIRAPAAAAGQGGVDLQAQFLGDPVQRFRSTLNGKETVAGRSAFVLTMIPRTAMAYKQLKVWIDEKDALARRFEIAEENGNVRRFELRDVQVNTAIADDVFKFVPPAGARVIERG
jgi:chaperone LolA